jgi:hypothetical protein
MKYHSLPSLSDLRAYQQGRLSDDERSWIDSVINTNPLVADVFKNLRTTNDDAVQRVSSSVSDRIAQTYIPNRGFWSKYAGWIGLSSIVLIIGSIYFFNLQSVTPKYLAEKSSLEINRPDGVSKVSLISKSDDEQAENLNDESSSIDSEVSSITENKTENAEPSMSDAKVDMLNQKEGFKLLATAKLDLEEDDESQKNNDLKVKQPDNTRGFDNTKSTEKSGTVLLAVNSVNILSKLNPDDFNIRSTSSGGNDPLGRGDTKRENNSSYSMNDLPSFPGGDQALINYFKGELRPIKIPAKADQFDRSVMIELEVNSRGKLKDYKIFGNLHPTHQEQLEKAIANLPQFEKGKGEKVKYSLAISF